MAKVGTFDFDPLVVKGWNEKLNLTEGELSKFVPFVKVFAVLGNKEKGGRQIEIVGKGTKRVEEIGKIISQTQDRATFRGGIGITELSSRYAAVEAGMLELRLGVIISDFNQFELDENNQLVIVSVLDNLIKGASGHAVQNMNIMFGFKETMGL